MAVKFDKFKKDVLAAVLKMNQSQDATNISDIRAQLAEIKVLVRDLEALENYYTKEEIDENHYNKSEIDSKTETLTNLTTMLNGSVGSMSRRISGLETNLSDILPVVNRLNQIDHSQFVTARDVSDVYDLDPGEYIGNLDGYATQEYVDNAIANALNSITEDDEENNQGEKGLTEQEELLIASAFNDLNNRVSELENNCVVTDNSN